MRDVQDVRDVWKRGESRDESSDDGRDPAVPLQVLGEKEVFSEHGGADFTVVATHVRVRETGGELTIHTASVKGGTAGAVCVVTLPGIDVPSNRRYLLARHWRVAIRDWAWEFPRGMGEPGETPVQTVLRELREETGIVANDGQVRILQHIHADSGVLTDDIKVALITLGSDAEATVSTGDLHGTDWELSDAQWVTASRMNALIRGGHIADGITLAAFAVCQAAVCDR